MCEYIIEFLDNECYNFERKKIIKIICTYITEFYIYDVRALLIFTRFDSSLSRRFWLKKIEQRLKF